MDPLFMAMGYYFVQQSSGSFNDAKLAVSEREEFCFDSFPSTDFSVHFRFRKADITKLQQAIGLQDVIYFRNGSKRASAFCLCVFLKRMASCMTYNDLAEWFGSSYTIVAYSINSVLHHMYEFCHKDVRFSHLITVDRMRKYATAVQEQGSPLPGCWGFLEGTVRQICRPTEFQEAVYNGHKKSAGLKYQGVAAPDGMIVSLMGPYGGRVHDIDMLRVSGLETALGEIDYGEDDGNFYVYADAGYNLSRYLQVGFSGANLTREQKDYNYKMSRVRQCVEWSFGKIVNIWKGIDFTTSQRTGTSPVGKYYICAVFLCNIHTCLYGSQASDFYDIKPPSFDEYISGF
jgi:hypothetical protein